MRDRTRETIERLSRLGEVLGFLSQLEYSSPYLVATDAVRPRHDVVWCERMSKPARTELARCVGRPVPELIPIVGFEVEGTAPTTKTMQTDALSLVAGGTPLGVVIVADVRQDDCRPGTKVGAEGGERNIYRRCARVLRSLRRAHGAMRLVPVDLSWLPALERACGGGLPKPARRPSQRPSLGSGGEADLTKQVRASIRLRGETAGFRVLEDWTPPEIYTAEACFMETPEGRGGLRDDPFSEAPASSTKAFTHSKIDVVWMHQLPPGLSAFLRAVQAANPDLTPIYGIDPAHWDEWPIAGFELETGEGKHASGSMLNLNTYCGFGVCVAVNGGGKSDLPARLAMLKAAFGLPRVTVQEASLWTE